MDESTQLPKRLMHTRDTEAVLEGNLPTMTKLIEHRRASSTVDAASGRSLRNCVEVQMWVEEDGTESIVVVGDDSATALEVKGLLHDGLYALAHAGEPGFEVEGATHMDTGARLG